MDRSYTSGNIQVQSGSYTFESLHGHSSLLLREENPETEAPESVDGDRGIGGNNEVNAIIIDTI